MPSPVEAGPGPGFYRTRGHMVIRLNRRPAVLEPTGTYRCEIPGANGINITRYMTLQTIGKWVDYVLVDLTHLLVCVLLS